MPGSWIWDFWAPHYHGLWAQYFVLSRSRAIVRQRIAESCADFTSLLDAGCGVGELVDELHALYPQVQLSAFDPSAKMVALAAEQHPVPGVRYRQGVLDDEPGGPFDVITMCNAFPYVEDHALAAQRMRALCKPGGRVMIVQANSERFWDKLTLAIVKTTTSKARYHKAAELAALFTQAGFLLGPVTRVDTWNILPTIQLCEFIAPVNVHKGPTAIAPSGSSLDGAPLHNFPRGGSASPRGHRGLSAKAVDGDLPGRERLPTPKSVEGA